MIVAGGGVGFAGRYLRVYIRHFYDLTLPDPTVDLLKFHQSYGYNAQALVGIAPGIRLWNCAEAEGAVAYNEFGRVWLVPGDPFATSSNLARVTDLFLRKACAEGRVVGFMPATERFAKCVSSLGLRTIKIGAAPYFELATWAPRGDRAKKARAGVNQARRAGVRVEGVAAVEEKLVRETACLCKSWLSTRRSALRFEWLLAVDLFQHQDRKKYFTARDPTGKLVGFLAASPIPARNGWYLEDVLRSKNAPNGTTDLLVMEVLEQLKRDGAKLATLGTALMAREGYSHPEVHDSRFFSAVLRLIAYCCSPFYNFDGVRRFKAKFAPSWWESEYVLMSQTPTAPLRIGSAFVKAIIPAGPSTLIARQMSRAWRRMTTTRTAEVRERTSDTRNLLEKQMDHSASHNYPMQSVSVNGVALNYVSAGQGRPVVLIHGNPGSHEDFTLAVIGKLSQAYHVIAFDRPGHGYSERQDSLEASVDAQAGIIRNALRKLSIERPILVGHSWGGSLALAAALRYQSDIAGLVLLAPAAYPTVNIEWWSFLPPVPLLGRLAVKTLTPLIGRTVVKESLRKAYHPQEMSNEYAERSVKMWTKPPQLRAAADDERTLRASLKTLSQRYHQIEMPVIIVTGSADRVLEPKHHALRLHKAIKRSQLVLLPETGHQLPQTRPDAVITAVDEAWREAGRNC